MANAFAVSAPTKDQLRQSKQLDNEESKRGRESTGRSVTQSIAGKTEVSGYACIIGPRNAYVVFKARQW